MTKSKVDHKLIRQLADLSFTEEAQNVVFIGGTGTGKTHLATALGVSGIGHHNKRVRFFSTVDLANALEQEKAAGKAGRIALGLLRMDLVILDEQGYLPFSQAGGALLFHLLSKLGQTNCGFRTSPTFPLGQALSMSPSSSTSLPAASSAGASVVRCVPTSFWMRWNRHSTLANPSGMPA